MSKNQHQILIADDEPNMRKLLRMYIQDDYTVFEAGDLDEATRSFRKQLIDVILLDIEFPHNVKSIDYIDQFYAADPEVQIIMVTGFQQYEIDAGRKRAFGYMVKPIIPQDLQMVLKKAIANKFEMRRRIGGPHGENRRGMLVSSPDESFIKGLKAIFKEEFHVLDYRDFSLVENLIKNQEAHLMVVDYASIAEDPTAYLTMVQNLNPSLSVVVATHNINELLALKTQGLFKHVLYTGSNAMDTLGVVERAVAATGQHSRKAA